MPQRKFDSSKLRDCRVLKRMSQTDLGTAVGVKTNTVYRWETRQATPPPERLPGIAKALRTDLDELFPRSGPPDLADLRCDAGLSRTDTEKLIKMKSPMVIRAAESGLRPLPERLHDVLAQAYAVTIEHLLAAQKRTFGQEVPALPADASTNTKTPPTAALDNADELPAGLVARRLSRLRTDVYLDAFPPDADIAEEGNRRTGRPVLSEELVEDLRRGRLTPVPDEVLDALALAFDVPLVFFRTQDPEVEQLVLSARAVRHRHTALAARGGQSTLPAEVRADLRAFIDRALDFDTTLTPGTR